MTIRAAAPGDFDAIAAITNHYIATTAIHFSYDPVTRDELVDAWQSTRERHPWLVLEQAGVIIGYAKSGPWRERAAYAWTCEVGLYVVEGAHRRGLGTALYSELLDQCAAFGLRSAVAGITVPNPASVALHERLGFVLVGVFRDAGWKQGAWHDVVFYQKLLATGPRGPNAGDAS
ncbi:MAG: GCN5-related N-acetyltransferase [Myxococcales bacterium]|nr:GCN5-related N-acetyltransferase [Myxococcales bacterium]